MGHDARQENERKTQRIIQWRPRESQSVGPPQNRWIDDSRKKWPQIAQDRLERKRQGDIFLRTVADHFH